MISSAPNQLHIFDPNTHTDVIVGLSKAPSNLSVSPDGRKAAVGHDSLVTYVDLVNQTVVRTFVVSVNVADIILASEWAHVTNLGSIKLADGTISGSFSYYTPFKGRLHPNAPAIYSVQNSSSQIYRFDVSAGPAGQSSGNYSTEQRSVCGLVWFNPAGDRIYNSCGTVFRSSIDSSKDMRYRTSFPGTSYIAGLAESSSVIAVFESPSSYPYSVTKENVISLFDSAYLAKRGKLWLPDFTNGSSKFESHARWIYFNNIGNTLWTIVQADATSGLLNDYAVHTFNLDGGTCFAAFDSSTVTVPTSGGIYRSKLTSAADCAYGLTPGVPWIKHLDLKIGAGAQTATFYVEPNPANAPRSGTIITGGQTLTIQQEALGTRGPLERLYFKVKDAEYDRSLDRIVMIPEDIPELVLYEPSTRVSTMIALPLPALCVSVAPGGKLATVGHNGWISHINLETGTVTRRYEIDTDVNDIVYGSNGFVYGLPASPTSGWRNYSLKLDSGIVTTTDANYAGRTARLQPGGRYVYFVNGGASKWDTAAGTLSQVSYSSYSGTYPGNLWFSTDGVRVYVDSGNVYRASEDRNVDTQPNGSLSASQNGLRWADHSAVLKTVAVIPGNSGYYYPAPPPNVNREIQFYGDASLGYGGKLLLGKLTVESRDWETSGRYVFWNKDSTALAVVSQVNADAKLDSDYVVEYTGGRACGSVVVSNTVFSASPDGATGSINVATEGTCMWTVTTSADWLTINSVQASFDATGIAEFTASRNLTGFDRSTSLAIGNRIVTVNQAAGSSSLTLGASSVSFPAAGGTGTLGVTATPSTLQWTSVSSNDWITINSGVSGTGNGTVSYAVAPNPSPVQRSGTISVSGRIFTITQAAFVPGIGGLRFVAIPTCRIVDTRNPVGPYGGPYIGGQQSRTFNIPYGPCSNIPSDAAAFALNVTVVPKGPLPYLTLFPAGQTVPNASTLNSLDGRIKATAAIVLAGTNGGVGVFVAAASEVILDISGYFVPAATNPSGLVFYPLPPCRLVDTRLADTNYTGLGAPLLFGQQTRSFSIRNRCGIPTTAQAYSLNTTVVPSGPLPFLTMWGSGTLPVVSTLNSLSGTVVANAAIVPAGSNGVINVYAAANTHLVVDVNGYFAPPGSVGGLQFYSLKPCRILDSRDPAGPFGGPILTGQASRTVTPTQNGSCAVPSEAQAYSLNATVVPVIGLGYLTLYPAGQSVPIVSTTNSTDGSIVSNAAIVPAVGGSIAAFPSNQTHLILDINGYFAP